MTKEYRPLPCRVGNTIVKDYTIREGDALVRYVDYIDKKCKLHIKFVMQVKWG